MTNVSMCTWNVHGGLPFTGSATTVEASCRLIADLDHDVVALQEIELDGRTGLPARESMAILDATGLPHVRYEAFSESHHSPGRLLATAVASRWSVDHSWRTDLPNPALSTVDESGVARTTHDKGVLWSRLLVPGGPALVVGSVHAFPFRLFGCDATSPRFRAVWNALSTAVDRIADDPVALLGDFNSPDRTLVLARLRRRALRSATNGLASRPWGSADDDILLSEEFTVTDAFVTETFSDHHTVSVRATLA